MSNSNDRQSSSALNLARIAWILAALICSFTVENIWMDRRLMRLSHHKIPSLVPESLSAAWVLAVALLGGATTLAILSAIFVIRDQNFPFAKKALTAGSVGLAVLLCALWLSTTSGAHLLATSKPTAPPPPRSHKVALHWKPSTTKNVRYNIYRGQFPGAHPEKLNLIPLEEPAYTDTTANDGVTYYYAARAVDSLGHESTESNEAKAEIPR